MSVGDLSSLIQAEHANWERPVVDEAVFGTSRPVEIAALLSGFCRDALGAGVAEALFYRVSVACVAGLTLEDGRKVVVKAQRGRRKEAYLRACVAFRRRLVEEGFPCPLPLSEATRVGPAWVTAEGLMEAGSAGDAHDPVLRQAIAGSLARLVSIGEGFSERESFGRAWFLGLPEGQVFPAPHSPFFDFEATAGGAEWIDAFAREARQIGLQIDRSFSAAPKVLDGATPGAGEGAATSALASASAASVPGLPASAGRVVGHFDYRVEHLRFDGGRVVATFDWDSLHFERLPVLLGALAPHFTADWQREDIVRAPTLDEMRAFVTDFEVARGQPFSAVERWLLSASCVYSMSYTARCNHASNPREEGWNGDLRPMLRAHGRALLDGGL